MATSLGSGTESVLKTMSLTNKHVAKSLEKKQSQQDALALSAMAETIVSRHEHLQTKGGRQGHTRSCASESAKEPCISTIESFISASESCISAEEPYLYETEPNISAKEQYVTATEPFHTRLDEREVGGVEGVTGRMQKFADGGGGGMVAATRCNAQQHAATHCLQSADYDSTEQLEEKGHGRERAREEERSREKERESESRRTESGKESAQVQESVCVYVRVREREKDARSVEQQGGSECVSKYADKEEVVGAMGGRSHGERKSGSSNSGKLR